MGGRRTTVFLASLGVRLPVYMLCLSLKDVGLTRAVRECLGGSKDANLTSAPPGERILRVYVQEYFEDLAQVNERTS